MTIVSKPRRVQVLAKVLAMAVKALESRPTPDAARMVVEATISTLQALISLVDEAAPRGAPPDAAAASRRLQELAAAAGCDGLVARAASASMAALTKLPVRV
jgi:hypothetical protein